MRLTPIDPQPAIGPCSVAVISYCDVGNFGDRLGYHMINSLLPSEANVHHLTFHTLSAARDHYDLVVLGIGNSIFELTLTQEMFDVLKRGKAKIGIFGTQYRELIHRPVMDHLIDQLDVWYARSEDDIYLFGRGRNNVQYLGDWLIDQFPMATPIDPGELQIGDEIKQQLPLDRTIQHIQKYRRVFSTRLHPLLCALTSAAEVAYAEQGYPNQPSIVSGKFRGMLTDIFGRTYPEKDFFVVDRDAVARYKKRVHGNLAGLRSRIEAILSSVVVAPTK